MQAYLHKSKTTKERNSYMYGSEDGQLESAMIEYEEKIKFHRGKTKTKN